MKNMNLLPPAIEKYKQMRKLKIGMVVLQVTIFLCIGMVILFLHNYEQRILNRSHELSESIANFNERPLLLAAELEQARTMTRYFDEFVLMHFPVEFNTIWVATIFDTLPNSAKLTQLNYNHLEILLLGEAEDIEDAQTHRQELINSPLFDDVSLNSIALLENGMFSYELHIWINQDEE